MTPAQQNPIFMTSYSSVAALESCIVCIISIKEFKMHLVVDPLNH
jgi:hypothetical protein